METIDKIRAEIERIKKQDGVPYYPEETADQYYARGVLITCYNLLSFLDTLEEKPVDLEKDAVMYCFDKGINLSPKDARQFAQEWWNKGYIKGREDAHKPAREVGLPKKYDYVSVDLEKEIERYLQTECAEDDEPSISEIARHFYELGRSEKPNNHLEQIVCPKCGAIQTAKVEHTAPFYSYVHTCEKCGYTILESEWEHPNNYEGLDEVASRAGFDYVDDIVLLAEPNHRWNDHDVEFAYRDGMIAGAKWNREQMMKEAVYGVARPDDCEVWVNLVGYGINVKDGDKVKLIIIKED